MEFKDRYFRFFIISFILLCCVLLVAAFGCAEEAANYTPQSQSVWRGYETINTILPYGELTPENDLTPYATRSLEEIDINNLKLRTERKEYDSDEHFANFRQIKAGDMAEGVLYRSSSLAVSSMGEERARTADGLAEKAGIRTVLNLAFTEEELKAVLSDANLATPYYRSLYEQGCVYTEKLPYDTNSAEFKDGLARGLIFLAEHDPPYLIHCHGGKDRTGFAAMILEMFMGATEEEIVADYMMTNTYFYGVRPGTKAYDDLAGRSICSIMKPIIGGAGKPVHENERILRQAARTYLLNIGIPGEIIEQLETKLKTRN